MIPEPELSRTDIRDNKSIFVRRIAMKWRSVPRVLGSCILVGLVLLTSTAANASGTVTIITPHAGSDLETCVEELRQLTAHCGPYDVDVLVSSSYDYLAMVVVQPRTRPIQVLRI